MAKVDAGGNMVDDQWAYCRKWVRGCTQDVEEPQYGDVDYDQPDYEVDDDDDDEDGYDDEEDEGDGTSVLQKYLENLKKNAEDVENSCEAPADRRVCTQGGDPGLTREDCNQAGCCWDSTTPNNIICSERRGKENPHKNYSTFNFIFGFNCNCLYHHYKET